MTVVVQETLSRLEPLVAEETENSHVKLSVQSVAGDIAGWDSVAHSRIMLRVEDEFGITVEDEKMYSFETVGSLVNYIQHRMLEKRASLDEAPAESNAVAASEAALTDDGQNPNDAELAPTALRAPVFNLFSDARYPAPYMMFRSRPSKDGKGLIDQTGFPNRVPPQVPKPKGERRVFVVGNSVIRGGDIIKHLQTKVDSNGQQIKFYNFGAISANCYQMLMFFVWQGFDLSPDLIVLYDGYSDIALPVGYDARPGYPYNHHMLELVHEYMGEGRISELDFPREETKRRNAVRVDAGWKTPEWEAQIAASYAGCIRKWHTLCEAYNIPVVTILQSTLAFKDAREGIEIKRCPAFLATHVQRCYEMVRNQISAIKQELSGPRHGYSDLSRLFSEETEQCYVDMVHPLKHRYEDVGEHIFAEIAPFLARL